MKTNNERALTDEEPAAHPAHAPFKAGAAGIDAIADAWAMEFDLEKLAAGLAHVSIAEKRVEQIVGFSKVAFMEGLKRNLHMCEPTDAIPVAPTTFEGLADALLAPCRVVRNQNGFFSHPALPACDEDVRIDKLLAAFGLETKFSDLDSDPLSLAMKDRMYEAFNFADWTPTAPDGDGWALLQVEETENGVYALFARRALTPLQRLHCNRQADHAHRAEAA